LRGGGPPAGRGSPQLAAICDFARPLDDEEITKALVESIDQILFDVTRMEEAVAGASQAEIAWGDRVLIAREIDALWDQGDALMIWLVERPAVPS
jgi:hypothetical protein